MLSLARIGRGREDYHLRSVGADASTYYSERGEVAGSGWGGGSPVSFRDQGLDDGAEVGGHWSSKFIADPLVIDNYGHS